MENSDSKLTREQALQIVLAVIQSGQVDLTLPNTPYATKDLTGLSLKDASKTEAFADRWKTIGVYVRAATEAVLLANKDLKG